ncbi:MAG TPA: hypothetical protein VFB99_23235 [Vicinamibacterales bacterium]|nr:hypothetical protein [Vicinamibacterales bacterium]
MKRHVLSVIVASVFATGLVAAQGAGSAPPQQPPQTQKAPEATITGCVIQGSSPTVFILEAARVNPQDRNEKVKTYVLVAGTEDLQFKAHLNHEVRVTGVAESTTPPTPPAGQKVAEKDLPKLTAQSVTMVADRCTTS